jgi:SPP1 family predicted phage head-tail adaptor
MKAGDLRHRVILQRPIEIRGTDYADVQRTWQDVATLWASVEPLSGREFFANAEMQGELTARVRLRYRPGVTPKMRLQYDGRIFEIQSVMNVNEDDVELELMVAESLGG